MISCLLIHVTRNPQGLPVRQDSVVEAETISIGRGAACAIHLPDHRVSMLHARISRASDGEIYLDGEGDVTLKINGAVAQRAALLPGMRVEIGPYLLLLEAASDDHDISISIEQLQTQGDRGAISVGTASPVTLGELGISKRKLGLVLAACILFVFLFLPVLPSVSLALDEWQADLPITLNGSWSPGPLAGGHALFESKCSTCHEQPFQAVADEVCTGCHSQSGKHLTDSGSQTQAFKGISCTDCHVDHKGRSRLQHDAERCISCHAGIKRINAASQLADVSDFATDHPAFRLTLPDGESVRRMTQIDKPVERSGLKYSHKVHLDKEGVSSPEGDTVMQCQDCHKLEASGEHFVAMTMEQSCQQSGCHRLDFTEPVEGRVPHGSVRVVMDRLRGFYGPWLADATQNRARCTPAIATGNAVQNTLDCVNEFARKQAAATLFRQNVECGECHEITSTADKDVPWKIAPLHINRDWQPRASFPHVKHGTMRCTACHDKENSSLSGDIAMPTIAKCRECHAGNHPARGKVVTGCDACHRFHRVATDFAN